MMDDELLRVINTCGLKIGEFDPVKANDLFIKADKFSTKEKWGKAEPLIRQAIECNPYEFRYWLLYGSCLNRLNRETDEHFEQSHVVFDYTMSRVDFEGMGKFVEALKEFGELEEESANDLQAKRWEKAEKGFKKLLEIKASQPEAFRNILDKDMEFPKDFMYWNAIAVSVENQGRSDEAEEAYRKSIEINPTEFHTWYFLGGLLSSNGRFEDAEAMYEEALKLDPKNGDIWCDLGSCLANQGKIAEAEEPFRKAVKYNPLDKGARDLLKRCLDYQGK
ncbi:MAG: tetratricopeptide repeat protein [Candidatus Heimdallarchaeaceae archaeon]